MRFTSRAEDKFAACRSSRDQWPGAVLMAGSAGTLSCTVHQRLVGRNHLLLIGRVVGWDTCAVLRPGLRRRRFVKVNARGEVRP